MDLEHQKDPLSTKKLLKGYGACETTKLILGWIVDTKAETIQLPSHLADRLHEILHIFAPDYKIVSIKIWQKLLRELHIMVLAIPGGPEISSSLQDAISKSTSEVRIRLNQSVHYFLSNFCLLASQLDLRPTIISKIVPGEPDYLGAADAAGVGMGGVWLIDSSQSPAMLHPPLL